MAQDLSSLSVKRHAEHAIFGAPLVDNRFRPILVEAMVDLATGGDWRWCSENWAGHDFEHATKGTKLEVKQSAKRQSWHRPHEKASDLIFDIAKRKGYYVGNKYNEFPSPRRVADWYLFAAHANLADDADHGDPSQWQFFLVAVTLLPDQKRIKLEDVQTKCGAAGFGIGELAERLAAAVDF